MDCFDTNGHWEEESHDSNSINGSCLLRTVIPLPGEVRTYVASLAYGISV